MAKVIASSVKIGDTVAGLQAWIEDFHALMLSAGLTQTADTGQLVTSSITALNKASMIPYGFRIYELLDAQASNLRMLIKVEFCGHTYSGVSAVGFGPATYISVGSQTNGAGDLTGSCTSARYPSAAVNGSAGQCQSAGSTISLIFTAPGRVVIAYGYKANLWLSNYGTAAFLVLSRTTDSFGVMNSDGLIALHQTARAVGPTQCYCGPVSQYLPKVGVPVAGSLNPAPCLGAVADTGQVNGAIQFQRVAVATPEIVAMRDVVALPTAVLTPFTPFQLQYFSEGPRDFIALGVHAPTADVYVSPSTWALGVAVDA